jgi:preprotein translocase subunit SecD
MSWRAAAVCFLPWLIAASFLAGCGGSSELTGAGVRILYEAEMPQAPETDADATLNAVADIIERRVDAYGGTAKVHREDGTRLAVDLTGISAEEAQKLTGQTGLFEFREPKLDENGNILLCQGGTVTYNPPGCEGGQEVGVPPHSLTRQSEETVIWVPALATRTDGQETALTGRFLRPNTFVSSDRTTELPVLNFETTSEGAPLLKQVAGRLLGLPMAFFLDGQPIRGEVGYILAPTVRAAIGDKGIIEGLTADDARMLSILLNSGALPVPLKVVDVQELGE